MTTLQFPQYKSVNFAEIPEHAAKLRLEQEKLQAQQAAKSQENEIKLGNLAIEKLKAYANNTKIKAEIEKMRLEGPANAAQSFASAQKSLADAAKTEAETSPIRDANKAQMAENAIRIIQMGQKNPGSIDMKMLFQALEEKGIRIDPDTYRDIDNGVIDRELIGERKSLIEQNKQKLSLIEQAGEFDYRSQIGQAKLNSLSETHAKLSQLTPTHDEEQRDYDSVENDIEFTKARLQSGIDQDQFNSEKTRRKIGDTTTNLDAQATAAKHAILSLENQIGEIERAKKDPAAMRALLQKLKRLDLMPNNIEGWKPSKGELTRLQQGLQQTLDQYKANPKMMSKIGQKVHDMKSLDPSINEAALMRQLMQEEKEKGNKPLVNIRMIDGENKVPEKGTMVDLEKELKDTALWRDSIKTLMPKYDREYLTYWGKIAKEGRRFMDKANLPEYVDIERLKSAAAFRTASLRLLTAFVQSTSGKSATEQEAKRLMEAIAAGEDIAPSEFEQVMQDVMEESDRKADIIIKFKNGSPQTLEEYERRLNSEMITNEVNQMKTLDGVTPKARGSQPSQPNKPVYRRPESAGQGITPEQLAEMATDLEMSGYTEQEVLGIIDGYSTLNDGGTDVQAIKTKHRFNLERRKSAMAPPQQKPTPKKKGR